MSVERAEAAENGSTGAVGTGPAASVEAAVSAEAVKSLEPVESAESMASSASAATAEARLVATTYSSIAPGYSVNVRSGPGTNYTVVRVLPEGSEIPINCQSPGTWITGPYGTTNIWDNIAAGQYVSDAYVLTGSDGYIRPRCS